MPSSATITSFYTFQLSTRPRVGNVNGNFSNFRGHLIPIDPNTATAAASGEYGFGAPEYRWATAYFPKLDVSLTSTTSLILETVNSNEFHFRANSVTGFYLSSLGFYGINETDFAGATTAAALGGYALSAAITATYTATASDVTGGSVTITTNGRPVLICLIPDSTAGSYLELFKYAEATEPNPVSADVGFKRGNTITACAKFSTARNTTQLRMPPSVFAFYDTPAAGTYTYQLFHSLPTDGSTPAAHISYNAVRVAALEL